VGRKWGGRTCFLEMKWGGLPKEDARWWERRNKGKKRGEEGVEGVVIGKTIQVSSDVGKLTAIGARMVYGCCFFLLDFFVRPARTGTVEHRTLPGQPLGRGALGGGVFLGERGVVRERDLWGFCGAKCVQHRTDNL
jgi:hypothetical protein